MFTNGVNCFKNARCIKRSILNQNMFTNGLNCLKNVKIVFKIKIGQTDPHCKIEDSVKAVNLADKRYNRGHF